MKGGSALLDHSGGGANLHATLNNPATTLSNLMYYFLHP